jgi:glycosyltransferase involved in cell wall biosynthesis
MKVVTVLVCTKDRPDSLLRAVRSLLRNDEGCFELIVIDQSEGDPPAGLAAFCGNGRLRYRRSTARGKGAAINEGLRLARSPIVVCTDDDCEASPQWPEEMARVMDLDPRTAIVFCNVVASPHDRSAGYVPAYERRTDRVMRSLADATDGIGLGAGMALRRDAVLAFGGFDETFGPGAPFSSGDDWDIAVRALIKGWHVYETAHVSVLHHGFRTLAEGRTHARRDWVAIGALCAKAVQTGGLSALTFSAALFLRKALWPPMAHLLKLRRPSGLARVTGFLRGFSDGLRTPVDRRTLAFRP